MNHFSKTHQRFSERLNNPRVLEFPEEILGPNYKEVLNFWLILDDLSKEQLKVVEDREGDFFEENYPEWKKASNLAWDTSYEVVDYDYAHQACWATLAVTNSCATCRATLELIAIHKILEDHQQPLTFFPMIIDQLS